MKILLVGAGAVASVMSQYFDKDPEITEVICGTNDTERAKEFINTSSGKIQVIELDATNIDDVASKAQGVNLIINVSLPRFNLNIMEACLKVGAHYQDLASDLLDLKTVEQLSLNENFKQAGLTALINTGVAPGVTNLLAREAADKLDEVDEIHFRCLEEQITSELILTWSAETTLDDITAPPLIVKNGEFALTKPFDDMEEYEFQGTTGKQKVFSLYGDEVATIPFYIKAKTVDFKSAGTDIKIARVLSRLGLLNKEPVKVNGVDVVPIELFKKLAPKVPSLQQMKKMVEDGLIENAIFALSVKVIGIKNGQKMTIKMDGGFPDLKEITKKFPGTNYISEPTGTAAYCFAKVIPKIKVSGVFPPEALEYDMRKEVMLNLEKNGVTISEQVQ